MIRSKGTHIMLVDSAKIDKQTIANNTVDRSPKYNSKHRKNPVIGIQYSIRSLLRIPNIPFLIIKSLILLHMGH